MYMTQGAAQRFFFSKCILEEQVKWWMGLNWGDTDFWWGESQPYLAQVNRYP